MFIFRSKGQYIGFIENGYLFSRDGLYLGWVEQNFVWDSSGHFRGQLHKKNGNTYIVFNRFGVPPVPRIPRKAPSLPNLPDPPANIPSIVFPIEWQDAF